MNKHVIRPEEQNSLLYWANKWGVTVYELRSAIIDTGYLGAKQLKTHLQDKGILFSFKGFARKMKKRTMAFFAL